MNRPGRPIPDGRVPYPRPAAAGGVEPGRKLPVGYQQLIGIFSDPGVADCISGQGARIFAAPALVVWFTIQLDGSEWIAFKDIKITSSHWQEDLATPVFTYLEVNQNRYFNLRSGFSTPIAPNIEIRKIVFGPGVVRLVSDPNAGVNGIHLDCAWSAWRGRLQNT